MSVRDPRPSVSPFEVQAAGLIEDFRDDQEARGKPYIVRQALLMGLRAIWVETFSLQRLCEVSSVLARVSINPNTSGVKEVIRDAVDFGLLRDYGDTRHPGYYEINLK
jgi:hypothetical protein